MNRLFLDFHLIGAWIMISAIPLYFVGKGKLEYGKMLVRPINDDYGILT